MNHLVLSLVLPYLELDECILLKNCCKEFESTVKEWLDHVVELNFAVSCMTAAPACVTHVQQDYVIDAHAFRINFIKCPLQKLHFDCRLIEHDDDAETLFATLQPTLTELTLTNAWGLDPEATLFGICNSKFSDRLQTLAIDHLGSLRCTASHAAVTAVAQALPKLRVSNTTAQSHCM